MKRRTKMHTKKLFFYGWVLLIVSLLTSCQPPENNTMLGQLPETQTDKQGVSMILIPDGPFLMGTDSTEDNDTNPSHVVNLSAYYIDKYEISNAEYQKCVDAGVCTELNREENFLKQLYVNWKKFETSPVTFLSWHEAQIYCQWRDARLPTEAEWEKAARGTDGRTYPWGEEISCNFANYGFYSTNGKMCMGGQIAPVGSYSKGLSPYGVYDMSGNVEEWVYDCYDEFFYKQVDDSPYDPTAPDKDYCARVTRGGNTWSPPLDIRTTTRYSYLPSTKEFLLGARCVWSPEH